jgi:hypothetical protein
MYPRHPHSGFFRPTVFCRFGACGNTGRIALIFAPVEIQSLFLCPVQRRVGGRDQHHKKLRSDHVDECRVIDIRLKVKGFRRNMTRRLQQ